MERNVDKVRKLEKQLLEAGEKISAGNRELLELRKSQKVWMDELREVAAALYIGMARKYGRQVEPGVWELELPERSQGALEEHRLELAAGEDGAVLARVHRK